MEASSATIEDEMHGNANTRPSYVQRRSYLRTLPRIYINSVEFRASAGRLKSHPEHILNGAVGAFGMARRTIKIGQTKDGFVDILEYESDGDGPHSLHSDQNEDQACDFDGSNDSTSVSVDDTDRTNRSRPRLLSDTLISPPIALQLLHEDLRREDERLGEWPRRLLHVDTLTSYEWQPGNVYGGVVEPRYNAITYTWGRWRLPESRQTEAEGLEVRGIPWSIPKVDPAHFTPEDLRKILANATKGHTNPNSSLVRPKTYTAVEFVWLDVACIDQRPGEPGAAAEIGRQAKIFKNAQTVFIWFSTLASEELQQLCFQLRSSLSGEEANISASDLQQASHSFRKLQADPWFSSLWTLQEAFLRSLDALFMSKDGNVVYLADELPARRGFHYTRQGRTWVTYPAETYISPFDLGELIDWASKLFQLGNKRVASSRGEILAVPHSAVDVVRGAGLLELATQNPMAVYTAASRRTASRQEDRIYGIEQIFGLRLGLSATDIRSGVRPRRGLEFSLADLQNQLGEQLMLKYPVLSQMHVYTKPAPPGTAWRVNETSLVAGIGGQEASTLYPSQPSVWVQEDQEDICLCVLDICIREDTIWGQFRGKMCAFETFHRNSQLCEESCIMAMSYRLGEVCFLEIWPDVVEELLPSPEHRSVGYHAVPCVRQRTFAAWLSQHFASRLKVMILGRELFEGAGMLERDGVQVGSNMLGMLMIHRSDSSGEYWRRIGICRWKLDDLTIGGVEDPWKLWFEGHHEDWVLTKGVFG